MFYEFHQNNSGGFFLEDAVDGIGPYVIIEAGSAEEANDRAERIGLYFDSYDEDGNYSRDCECCGSRWSEAWGSGSESPSVYGRLIVDGVITPLERESVYGDYKWAKDHEGYIHYLDGTVSPFDYAN